LAELGLGESQYFEKIGRMKKTIIFAAVFILSVVLITPAFAGARRVDVPRVAYLAPENDSVVDLTGKEALEFKWKNQPTPGGGRDSYRFRLYRGFSYDVVVGEDLGQGVYSVSIPADKFEDGKEYSWYVEQRDASNMLWSLHDTWSFKAAKQK